jgi:hypothetical protein
MPCTAFIIRPEGEYKVGRTKLFVTDADRKEVFSDAPTICASFGDRVLSGGAGKGDEHAVFASKAVEDVLAKTNGCPSFILESIGRTAMSMLRPSRGRPFPSFYSPAIVRTISVLQFAS